MRADWKTWRRPTLPCLKAQYHGRWGISRPSSGWDRVQAPRHGHQVVQSALLDAGRIEVLFMRFGLRKAYPGEHPPGCVLGMISMHGV